MTDALETQPRFIRTMNIMAAASVLAAGLAGCYPETDTPPQAIGVSTSPSPSPESPTPSETPTVTPSPSASASAPTSPKPKPKPVDPNITLQHDLNTLLVPYGMPKLDLDGKPGGQTKRALCAFRWLTGHQQTKTPATTAERQTLAHKQPLHASLTGFVISKTCQVMAVNVDNKLQMILPVSTGKPRHETPSGNFRIEFGRNDLHDSTKYPVEGTAADGNMYRPLYFYFGGDAAIALHGSQQMSATSTTARSHGCVRLSFSDEDRVWKLVGGDPKLATGPGKDARVNDVRHLPVHVLS